jgi:1-deoxy-D-xylulose-5-phosphate reductoisomerase
LTDHISSTDSSPATLLASPHATPVTRRLALLGSTGSIGCNVLDVVASLPGRFSIATLTAGSNIELLAEQTARFRPVLVSVRDACDLPRLRDLLIARSVSPLPELMSGSEGLLAAVAAGSPDMVVAATVGVAALSAVHAAVRSGLPVALANKETLIAAGRLILQEAGRSGSTVLPIDSEHSAIHQCLRAGHADEVEKLILTASGGPFRHFTPEMLESVTPEQALRHPTWRMGGRITLDSATLMNKGFEVIEACYLFGLDESRVDVVVHPQSIVHSMVEFRDGSVMAQLGTADMRTPIQYALTWPERLAAARPRLDLTSLGTLEFEAPNRNIFPCLRLAREAWRAGGAAGAVLNAADEVAGGAFLAGQIPFPRIAAVIAQVLERLGDRPAESLDEVLAADAEARQLASALIAT